jgi:hypothetical protein
MFTINTEAGEMNRGPRLHIPGTPISSWVAGAGGYPLGTSPRNGSRNAWETVLQVRVFDADGGANDPPSHVSPTRRTNRTCTNSPVRLVANDTIFPFPHTPERAPGPFFSLWHDIWCCSEQGYPQLVGSFVDKWHSEHRKPPSRWCRRALCASRYIIWHRGLVL